MKIWQNVYMLETTKAPVFWKGRPCDSMVYAVLEADGITLIDSGFPSRGKEILDEVRELGMRKLNIKQILLTHSDLDHMGNAAWIQEKSDCPVWISEAELVYTDGRKARFGEKQEMAEAFGLKNPQFSFYPRSGRLGDFEIIPTPGHSVGHVSIIYRKKILFGGDLFSCREGAFCPADPRYSEDTALAARSFAALTERYFTVLCPAHGKPEKRKNLTFPAAAEDAAAAKKESRKEEK